MSKIMMLSIKYDKVEIFLICYWFKGIIKLIIQTSENIDQPSLVLWAYPSTCNPAFLWCWCSLCWCWFPLHQTQIGVWHQLSLQLCWNNHQRHRRRNPQGRLIQQRTTTTQPKTVLVPHTNLSPIQRKPPPTRKTPTPTRRAPAPSRGWVTNPEVLTAKDSVLYQITNKDTDKKMMGQALECLQYWTH